MPNSDDGDRIWERRLTRLIVVTFVVWLGLSLLHFTHVLTTVEAAVCAIGWFLGAMVWGTRHFAREWNVSFVEALVRLARKSRE